MYKLKENRINISVRNLVEFIFQSGDIDNRRTATQDKDAMLKGAKLHRKIQGRMGSGYSAEVSFKADYIKDAVIICIEGRADGIIDNDGEITIDEIKGTYGDLDKLTEALEVHKAQAMCYAYMAAEERNLEDISVQLTYANIDTEEIKRFKDKYTRAEIQEWFNVLLDKFGVWANLIYKHKLLRDASIVNLDFPFEYRKGQKELAVYAYRTIVREKRMFVQAPTGIGKTMSMIYPSVKAMGEGKAEKIFYLTAKTITRSVAEESFAVLRRQGLDLMSVTITAKEKICVLEKAECNPENCLRAKGHFDRINDAVFYAVNNYKTITRKEILEVAAEFNVCPFELSLDISSFTDAIICDYNYVFDPNVRLKRYFADDNRGEYVFLIDEAHNLVERARKMYSASIIKEDLLEVGRIVKEYSRKLLKRINACNRSMLELKHECDDIKVLDSVSHLALNLMSLLEEMNKFSDDFPKIASDEIYKELYFNVRNFLNVYDILDENYRIYSMRMNNGNFMVKLLCVDPSDNITLCIEQGRAAIFFSATLLPMRYYCEMLSSSKDDYKVYIDSPFDSSNRMLAVAGDVSGRYSRRNEREYLKVADYISRTIKARSGNYIVFFPSYQYMNTVRALAAENGNFDNYTIIAQSSEMDESMREAFLTKFREAGRKPVLGLCVLGGIFSEGIDLNGKSLIGVLIVGTGIGQITKESKLISDFFEARGEKGFNMTYLYPGMNRVLQATGRVIRTERDQGVIALLDDRFLRREYLELFPKEWNDYKKVSLSDIEQRVSEFWSEKPDDN